MHEKIEVIHRICDLCGEVMPEYLPDYSCMQFRIDDVPNYVEISIKVYNKKYGCELSEDLCHKCANKILKASLKNISESIKNNKNKTME